MVVIPVRGVWDSILVSSERRRGVKDWGARSGREGCVVVVSFVSSELASARIKASAAARSEALGSVSMYGRDSWIAFVSGILAIRYDLVLVLVWEGLGWRLIGLLLGSLNGDVEVEVKVNIEMRLRLVWGGGEFSQGWLAGLGEEGKM